MDDEGVLKLGSSFRKCSHAKIESEVLKCWTADSSNDQAWMLTMKDSSNSCETGKVAVCVEDLELGAGEVDDLRGRAGTTLGKGAIGTHRLHVRYCQVIDRLSRSCLELYWLRTSRLGGLPCVPCSRHGPPSAEPLRAIASSQQSRRPRRMTIGKLHPFPEHRTLLEGSEHATSIPFLSHLQGKVKTQLR